MESAGSTGSRGEAVRDGGVGRPPAAITPRRPGRRGQLRAAAVALAALGCGTAAAGWGGAAALVAGRPPARSREPRVARTGQWIGGKRNSLMKREDFGYRNEPTQFVDMFKWNPNRKKHCTAEEAEEILMTTGSLPRPIRLCNVHAGGRSAVKRTIVATAKEMRDIAELVSVHAVTKLQAQMILRRERHPVWDHERVMVYAKMACSYICGDIDTDEPLVRSWDLKFKAAFREDFDPFLPTHEMRYNLELSKRGVHPDFVDGRQFEASLKAHGNDPYDQNIPDNFFHQAILDNVVDLGELIYQHFALYIDRLPVARNQKKLNKLKRRINTRMSADYGINLNLDTNVNDYTDPDISSFNVQDLHDRVPESYLARGSTKGFKRRPFKGSRNMDGSGWYTNDR